MANIEIDSFVKKFKSLCQLGRTAKLTLTSNAGKASINLSVDLEVLPQEVLPPPPKHSRNGPARLRRREKRAAARKADAEEAEAKLTTEEKEVLELAANAKNKVMVEEAIVSAKVATNLAPKKSAQVEQQQSKASAVEVTDEVCSDSEYGARAPPDESKAKPKSVEVKKHHPKPPPIREKTLGGKKYYTLTYEDPSDED